MKSIIFYFTGTGNSLAVARDIAKKIGETEILAIAEVIKEESNYLDYDCIGFVFPVYYSCMPKLVKNFILKLKFNKNQYIFGVATLGGILEASLNELNIIVEERGGTLALGYKVNMPGNYIASYGAYPRWVQKWIFRKEKKKVNVISNSIRARKINKVNKGNLLTKIIDKSIRNIIEDFNKRAQNFNTNSKCTGCRTCEKICPVKNINVQNGKPIWGNVCEHCMACIQWCPAKAIEYKDKTSNRVRYTNPEIKLKDMI